MGRFTALILMGFISILFSSCQPDAKGGSSSDPATPAGEREITSGMGEEGFIDLVFSTTAPERGHDNSQEFLATGSYNQETVGFRFHLPGKSS